MAELGIKRQFVLDTNVLIDLGAGKQFALAFLNAYSSRGLVVSPTAIQELTYIAFSNDHPAKKYALAALINLRAWGIQPFDLMAVGHGIVEVNVKKLIANGLLPEDEFNDGSILIETALAAIPFLVTSDKHLLRINRLKLNKLLAEFHLSLVRILSPQECSNL